jgi:hypothetical protein
MEKHTAELTLSPEEFLEIILIAHQVVQAGLLTIPVLNADLDIRETRGENK